MNHTATKKGADITHKSTILIVDDDPIACNMIKVLLSREGYELAFASNGPDALAKAAELVPDLILLDVMMPGMDGFEVCQRLRADPLMAEVPIIIITALADRASRLQGVEAGADDFVSKPLDPDELRARVQTIIRLNRYHLLRERAKFEQLVELSPEGIVIVDTTGAIGLANPAMLRTLGAEEKDVIGEQILAFVAPDQADYCSTYLRDVITGTSRVAQIEAWFVRTDGERFPAEINAGHFVWNGEPAAQVIVRDITERKRAEETLRRHADEQSALYAVASTAAALLDPDKMLPAILDAALPVLDSDAGWVTLLGPTLDAPPRLVAWRGVSESFLAAEMATSLRTCPLYAHLLAGGDPQAEPQLIAECPRLPPEVLASVNLHSHVSIALSAGDDVLGILNVAWRAPRPYSEADHALLTTIGQQVGLALRNAQLFQEARQVDRLQALNAITAAAVSSLELDTVLHQVLEMTCQALDAARGSILLSEPDTGGLFFAVTSAHDANDANDLRGQRLAPGQGIAGWVAQHGQPVYVNDVRHDPRFHDGMDAATGFETRSLCCAPLRHHKKITGVIEVVNRREGGFTDDDLSLLEAVSSIAAAALENARLYTTTQAHANELSMLNEIGLALTSTLDFSAVVHAALNQVQRTFQAEHVSLLQPDPQTGALCFVRTLDGATPVEIPLRLQPGESFAGWALEHRQPVLVENAQNDPRFSDRVAQYVSSTTRALMAAPLLTPERAIGVIVAANSEPGVYTRGELRTLQALASTLAVALENVRLYDELKTLLREREQAQAQLIHTEKMAALGRLVASIAHEINNPLQSVQGCLTLAQEELEDRQRREKLDRYLGIAGSEIERISAILRRMRDFYRPARAGLQPTDLHSVLESVLELTGKQLQHSNVTVERAWASELPAIQANPDHLKQVFLNLVLNGIDAMPAGGTLHISTALDQMSAPELPSASGGAGEILPAVRIEFNDTGGGMPPEVLSRLFEPFFTTKEGGTGLGLAISYGIIQSHNGQIAVENHMGIGTTFTILLPVKQP